MTRTLPTKARDAYLELVREFPLRAVKSEEDATKATAVLLKLVMSKPKLTAGEREYIEALTALVRQYEATRPRTELRSSSPLETLKHLLEESGSTISDLGRILGHQPSASEVLAGKRALSKSQIVKLAEHFRVSTDLFLRRDKT